MLADKPKTIIGIMNSGFHDCKSGGDTTFIEIFKRSPYKTLVVTSTVGYRLCKTMGLDTEFIITTSDRIRWSIIWTYIVRMVVGSYKILGVKRPDVIYVSSDILPDVIPALVCWLYWKIRGHNVIFYQKAYHIFSSERKISYYAQKLSLKLINLVADSVCTCSTYSADQLELAGVSRSKLIVNKLGSNFDIIDRSDKDVTTYDVVYLGRLHESKGIWDLLKIWRVVIQKSPNLTLGIVGNGSDEMINALKSTIREYGIEENIKLLGYCPDDEAFSYVKKSRVFAFPSHEEGFGIAIAEAMACAKPIVAYSLDVYSDIFEDKIKKVSCFDVTEFADALLSLLADEPARKWFGSQAREYAIKNFSWPNVAAREFELVKNAGLVNY